MIYIYDDFLKCVIVRAGLLQTLKVDKEKGLSNHDTTDISARQATFGINKPPAPKGVTFWELVKESFEDRVLQILLVGAVITLVVGCIQDPSTGCEWAT